MANEILNTPSELPEEIQDQTKTPGYTQNTWQRQMPIGYGGVPERIVDEFSIAQNALDDEFKEAQQVLDSEPVGMASMGLSSNQALEVGTIASNQNEDPIIIRDNIDAWKNAYYKTEFETTKTNTPILSNLISEDPLFYDVIKENIKWFADYEQRAKERGTIEHLRTNIYFAGLKGLANITKIPAAIAQTALLPLNLSFWVHGIPQIRVPIENKISEYIEEGTDEQNIDQNANMISAFKNAKNGNIRLATMDVLNTIGQMIPVIAPSFAGPVGIGISAGMIGAGSLSESSKKGISPLASTIDADIQAALGPVLAKTVGVIGGSLAKQVGKETASTILSNVKRIIDGGLGTPEIAKRIIAGEVSAAKSALATGIAREFGKELVKGGATMGSFRGVSSLSSYLTGTDPQALENMPEKLANDFLLGVTLSGISHGTKGISELRYGISSANQARDFLNNTLEFVAKARPKLLPESVGDFKAGGGAVGREFVSRVNRGKPTETVFTKREDFIRDCQEANLDPESIAVKGGFIESFKESENGSYIAIPTADFATKLPAPLTDTLKEDAKFSPSIKILTPRESDAVLQKAVNFEANREAEIDKGSKVIAERVSQSLISEGMPERVAKTRGEQFGVMINSLARETGESIEYWDEQLPIIQKVVKRLETEKAIKTGKPIDEAKPFPEGTLFNAYKEMQDYHTGKVRTSGFILNPLQRFIESVGGFQIKGFVEPSYYGRYKKLFHKKATLTSIDRLIEMVNEKGEITLPNGEKILTPSDIDKVLDIEETLMMKESEYRKAQRKASKNTAKNILDKKKSGDIVELEGLPKTEEEIKKVVEERNKLRYEKYHDARTGLENHEAWTRDLADSKYQSMFMLDLSQFKALNDTYGHDYGDRVLGEFAELLNGHGEKGKIYKSYRWGGDEFAGLSEIPLEQLMEKIIELQVMLDYEDSYFQGKDDSGNPIDCIKRGIKFSFGFGGKNELTREPGESEQSFGLRVWKKADERRETNKRERSDSGELELRGSENLYGVGPVNRDWETEPRKLFGYISPRNTIRGSISEGESEGLHNLESLEYRGNDEIIENAFEEVYPEEFLEEPPAEASNQPGKIPEQKPRARFTVKDGKILVEYLKDAVEKGDFTGYIHEMATAYMYAMSKAIQSPKASETLKSEYNKLLELAGAKSFESITPKGNDKISKAFELYAMEGKAPTPDMKMIFSKNRAWMLTVYKNSNIDYFKGVKLTSELIRIFNHMFSSENEIKQAEEAYAMDDAFFKNPSKYGMSPEETVEFKKAFDEAHEERVMQQMVKRMREEKRTRVKEWKEERASIRKSIGEEMNANPMMQARMALQYGTKPDGTELPEVLRGLKLNYKSIEDAFGKERLEEIPQDIYSPEGKVTPDEAAELFGVTSGDELLTKLAEGNDPLDLMDEMADSEMQVRHGNMAIDGTLTDEVIKSMYTDKTSSFIQKEMAWIASNKWKDLKGMLRAINRTVPKNEDIRVAAENTVLNKKIKDIKPYNWEMAELKARREAFSLLPKDPEGAFDAKAHEVINHELSRAGENALDAIDKIINYISKFSKSAVEKSIKHAGGGYWDQIENILDMYEFKTSLKKHSALKDWVKEQQDSGYNPNIPDEILEKVDKTHYRNLTYGQLQDVYSSIRSIEKLAAEVNKFKAITIAENMEALAKKFKDELPKHHDVTPKKPNFTPDAFDEWAKLFRETKASLLRPEWVAKWLDGNELNGITAQALLQPLHDSQNKEYVLTEEVTKYLADLFENNYTFKERALMFDKKYYVPGPAGHPKWDQSYYKPELLCMAANLGNPYNKQAILNGRYGYNNPFQITEEMLMAAVDHLTAKDWEVVKGMWEIYPKILTKEAYKNEEDINGTAPEMVEGVPFMTKYGVMPGGYFPLMFDPDYSMRQTTLDAESKVQELLGGNYMHTMTKHGYMHERKNTGGKPVSFAISRWLGELSDEIHDIAFRKAIIDVNRVLNNEQIMSLIENAMGRETRKMFSTLLKHVAMNRGEDSLSPIEHFLMTGRRKTTVLRLGGKFVSPAMQFLGIFNSLHEIGPEYMAKGLATMTNPRTLGQMGPYIKKLSTFMNYRPQNINRNLNEVAQKMNLFGVGVGSKSISASAIRRIAREFGMETFFEPIAQMASTGSYAADQVRQFSYFYLKLYGIFDYAVSKPTWMGAFQKALDGKVDTIKLSGSSIPTEKDMVSAVEYADSVVRVTQSAGNVKDLSFMERAGEFARLFSYFATEVFGNFQRYIGVAYKSGIDKKHGVKLFNRMLTAVGSILFLMVMKPVVESLFRREHKKYIDKYDKKWKGLIEWGVVKSVLSMPQTVIGLRDATRAIEHKYETGKWDYNFTPLVGTLTDILKTAYAPIKLVQPEGELGKDDMRAILNSTIGLGIEAPTDQIFKMGSYLNDWYTGEYDPSSVPVGVLEMLGPGQQKD